MRAGGRNAGLLRSRRDHGDGAEIVSFNAAHLRMIAASRKKCDRRDAYWLAKTLQSGLTPQPVYIPPHPIRRLRRLLQVRRSLQCDRRRWHSRARAALRSQGRITANGRANLSKLLERVLEGCGGLDSDIVETVEMYRMFIDTLDREIREVELQIRKTLAGNEVVERLVTIPGVGEIVAATFVRGDRRDRANTGLTLPGPSFDLNGDGRTDALSSADGIPYALVSAGP